MRVLPETICQSLYVHTRRAAKGAREPAAFGPLSSSLPGFRRAATLREIVPIAERPPEVDDRAVPDHREDNLIIGKGGGSAIAHSSSGRRASR